MHVAPTLRRYIVDLVEATRHHPDVYLGASPRASIMLLRAARAIAAADERDYVIPDDVKALAVAGARAPDHRDRRRRDERPRACRSILAGDPRRGRGAGLGDADALGPRRHRLRRRPRDVGRRPHRRLRRPRGRRGRPDRPPVLRGAVRALGTPADLRSSAALGHPGRRRAPACTVHSTSRTAPRRRPRSCSWRTGSRRRSAAPRDSWSTGVPGRSVAARLLHVAPPGPRSLPPGPAHRRHRPTPSR